MGFEIVFNRLDADFVIYLSGCQSSCAFKFNPTNPPYITVAGLTVDHEEVDAVRIVTEVSGKVREYFNKL